MSGIGETYSRNTSVNAGATGLTSVPSDCVLLERIHRRLSHLSSNAKLRRKQSRQSPSLSNATPHSHPVQSVSDHTLSWSLIAIPPHFRRNCSSLIVSYRCLRRSYHTGKGRMRIALAHPLFFLQRQSRKKVAYS